MLAFTTHYTYQLVCLAPSASAPRSESSCLWGRTYLTCSTHLLHCPCQLKHNVSVHNNSKHPRRQIMLTLVHIIFPPFPWSRRTTCFYSLPSLFFYTSFQHPVCAGKNFPIGCLQFISLNSLCAQDERHLIILIMSDLIITRKKMRQSRTKRPKPTRWYFDTRAHQWQV